MFDFERFSVYQKAKAFNKEISTWLRNNTKIDSLARNQLRRAALSIPLNIAEGTGRFTPKDVEAFVSLHEVPFLRSWRFWIF